jgi:hypothetical protein
MVCLVLNSFAQLFLASSDVQSLSSTQHCWLQWPVARHMQCGASYQDVTVM